MRRPPRGGVLRGSAAAALGWRDWTPTCAPRSPYAGPTGVDPRLIDPQLQRVVEEAAAQARLQAQENGYADGFEAGREAAQAQVLAAAADFEAARAAVAEAQEAALRDTLRSMAVAVEGFERRQAPALETLQDLITETAFELARVLVGRELELSATLGRDAVARALALAPNDTPVVVRVHPQALAELGDVTGWSGGRSVTVVPDPTVEPGGCIADAGACHIDAQISPAVQRVRALLEEKP